MGCCFSSGKASGSAMARKKKKKKKKDSRSKSDFSNVQSGAMHSREAPPLMEEESVKEVLSETPTPKPPPLTTPIVQLQRETQAHKPILEKMKEVEMTQKRQPMNEAEEKSEISEVCSLSESLSTVKTDENEEGYKKTNRSPAKLMKNRTFSADLEPKKDWVVTASPNRRQYQSPGRSYSTGGRSLKMVQSRDSSHGPAIRGLRSEAHRRDPYEKSSRRSKSPAATRSDNGAMRPAMGHSPSIRRVGRSPSRSAASPAHAVGKNREESELKERTPAGNESLENPLVSLECFIFL